MNILAYTPTYYGSGHNAGAETTLHDILRVCKLAGHRVMALGSRPFKDGSGSYVLDGVMVQAFGSKHDPDLYFPRFDVVLTQFECAQRAWYIGQKYDIPTVQVVHNNTEYATNLAVRYNENLIYNSHHVKQSIEAEMPFYPARKVKPNVVLHPIVDPAKYGVETTREYITLINLSDGEEPFYNKGYETFYQMAERFPNEKFLGVKGAYGNQVVRELPNVTIMEHTNNVLDVYRKTKVLLMPSQVESYGRVAIEGGCSAIPSVTSDTPGLLENGIGYLKVPFDDYDGWEDALGKVLADYDRAAYLAKDKAERLYLSSKYEIEYFLEFIEEIAKKK